jgi:hypothetical protein
MQQSQNEGEPFKYGSISVILVHGLKTKEKVDFILFTRLDNKNEKITNL